MLNDDCPNAQFLGMGFAGTEMRTYKEQAPDIILPDNVERPMPVKQELGFNAIKAWNKQPDGKRQHFGIGTQPNCGR